MRFPQVMGVVHFHTLLVRLRNDLADCVQIWCVVRDLSYAFSKSLLPLHARSCTHISFVTEGL